MNYKIGNIIYFKVLYKVVYSKQSGDYKYHFKPGDRYRIDHLYGKTASITNLEDGTSHFLYSTHWNRIISIDELRDIKLKKLGI